MKDRGLLFALAMLSSMEAYAYLDPATGGLFFSATFGILTTLYFILKNSFFKLKEIQTVLFDREATRGSNQSNRIVVFSEGSQYWDVFKPIVEELIRRKIKISYLSCDAQDPGLALKSKFLEGKNIGQGAKAYFYMNTLKADLVLMTTPGLDVLQLKRSPGVKHYCHVTHAAGGFSNYSAFSLDYFDSVLVGGRADQTLVRELEAARTQKKKELRVIGCTYLDTHLERIQESKGEKRFRNQQKTLMISPTWGTHGLLNAVGSKLIARLLQKTPYNLILRPHPQSKITEAELLETLQKNYPNSERVYWDFERDNFNALYSSDLMISDFSGVIFDYLFLFERPVLVFSSQYEKAGKEAMFLDHEPWNIATARKVARSLKSSDIENIDQVIEESFLNGAKIDDFLEQAKLDSFQHPGRSGQKAADALEEFLEKI